jgi:LacI family transcriptional regulator
MEDTLLDHLRFRKVPLVFVDVGPNAPGIVNIRINYLNGIRQAVQHLAALRHTRIAFISGPSHLKSAIARKAAFVAAMTEIGLVPDLIVEGNHRMDGGMRALVEFDSLSNRPTAVLCSNDMTAIGVMREAYDQDVKIPNDLSVIGFDDIRLAEFTIPPLTTVQMSQTELARIAFQALLSEVQRDTPSQERCEYDLNTNLVLRRSTALAQTGKQGAKRRKAIGQQLTQSSVRRTESSKIEIPGPQEGAIRSASLIVLRLRNVFLLSARLLDRVTYWVELLWNEKVTIDNQHGDRLDSTSS